MGYAKSLNGALIDINLLSKPPFVLTDEQALERLVRIKEIIETAVKLHAARAAEMHHAAGDGGTEV